jgi:succinate dehydrogenase / fumarate reductase cytochrome b subunit
VKRLRAFWDSTLGKKAVMGATGLLMIAWVVLHMAGNLQAFRGAVVLNGYSGLLHGPLHEALILMRVVLLGCVVLHVTASIQLARRNSLARPEPYARKAPQAATAASRTIRVGGWVLLTFVVLHLLHLTTGQIHPDFVEADVYHNLVVGLARPLAAAGYLIAMVSVGLHVYHGAWSSWRSLGLSRESPRPLARPIARGLAVLVWLGFSVIPVAVLLGWIQ